MPPKSYRYIFDNITVRWCASIAFLFLGSGVLIERGIGRSLSRFSDYAWIYLPARAWYHGYNPYRIESLILILPHDFPSTPSLSIETPYPPAIFPLLSLFSMLGWNDSRVAFLVFSLTAYLIACFLLIKAAEVQWETPKGIVFLGIAFLMYPLSTGLSLGQSAVIGFSFLIISFYFSTQYSFPLLAGITGAISLAFKPQLGVIFFIYMLIRRQFTPLMYGIAFYSALSLIGLLVPTFNTNWFLDIKHNLVGILSQKSQNYTLDEYCCLNLHMITREIGGSPLLAVSVEVLAVMLLWAMFLNATLRHRNHSLVEIAMLSTIVLLSVFHRPYDGLVMLILLAVIFSPSQGRGFALSIFVLGLIFFQPIPTLGALSTWFGSDPESWSAETRSIWHILIVPHTTWLLLALFAVLYVFATRAKLPYRKASYATAATELADCNLAEKS